MTGTLILTALPMASAYTLDSFQKMTDSSASASSVSRTNTLTVQTSTRTTASAAATFSEDALMNYLHSQYCNTLPTGQHTSCLQPLSTAQQAARRRVFHAWYQNWLRTAQNSYNLSIENTTSSVSSTSSSSSSTSNSSSVGGSTSLSPDHWQDLNGNWLKVQNDKLVWSTNQGQSWTDIPNRTWQGPDGWYRFDDSWQLQKSANGGATWDTVNDDMWLGEGNHWFSLDQNGVLTEKSSTGDRVDLGGTWQVSNQDYWMDKNNQWVKYMNGRLLWSSDNGITWTMVPGSAWQASDGTWYRFDDSNHLSSSTDGGITWELSTDNMWSGSDNIWYQYNASGNLMVKQGTGASTNQGSSLSISTTGIDQLRAAYEACQNLSPRRRTDCEQAQQQVSSTNTTR